MLISTQTDALYNRFGLKEALRILAEVGFEAYDVSLFAVQKKEDDPLNGEYFREYAKEIRAYADSLGIVCNQTHAIFPPVRGDEEDPARYQTLLRHLEISGILGAKASVVHPAQHLPYLKNKEALRAYNMEFYRGLIPYCEKFNIKIAVENMWQRYYSKGSNRICRSVCAAPAEFKDYMDALNSPRFIALLDVGHVSLVGEDMTEMIHTLGSHLRALHLHDTDTFSDLHIAPFHGRIDYQEVTQALADIDYQGDITLEADNFYAGIPADDLELNTATAAYLCAVAKALRRMIQSKKK